MTVCVEYQGDINKLVTAFPQGPDFHEESEYDERTK